MFRIVKNKLSRILTCGIAALALVNTGAHATLNGYSQDPGLDGWNRGDAGTGYAVFDLYNTWQFAPTSAEFSMGITAPVWSQTYAYVSGGAGGGLYTKQTSVPAPGNDALTSPNPGGDHPGTNGDVLFTGANPINLVLQGTVSFTIRGMVLQVKRAGSTGNMADALGLSIGAGTAPTLSINGGPAIPYDATAFTTASGDTNSDTGNSSITSYYWNASLANLTEGATNTYTINVKKGTEGAFGSGMNRGVDGFEVDAASVAAVPEPASAGLLACGFGVVVLLRRRRLA